MVIHVHGKDELVVQFRVPAPFKNQPPIGGLFFAFLQTSFAGLLFICLFFWNPAALLFLLLHRTLFCLSVLCRKQNAFVFRVCASFSLEIGKDRGRIGHERDEKSILYRHFPSGCCLGWQKRNRTSRSKSKSVLIICVLYSEQEKQIKQRQGENQ